MSDMVFAFLWLTSLSMIMSRSIHVAANGSISFFNTMKVKVSVAQSCLNWIGSQSTPCEHMDYSPPGSSVHGILQARILEWVAIPFSRGSSQPRYWTWVSCNAGHAGLIPGLGRLPGEWNSNSLQYSCLWNPMDRGAWWAIVHGITKSQIQLSK